MFQNIKALLFDMDGTLVNSMWMWKQIDIEYLAKFGMECPPDLQKSIEGKSFYETAVYIRERFQIQDSLEQMMDDWNRMAEDKYAHEVPLKPHVYEFLKTAHEKGLRMGICTSNSRHLADKAINALGILPFFSCILASGEVEHGKPEPDIYLECAKRLGVQPSECVVFEDIAPGIVSGKAAGMKVVAVEDDYSLQDRSEKEALADMYITDYAQLLPYIAQEADS